MVLQRNNTKAVVLALANRATFWIPTQGQADYGVRIKSSSRRKKTFDNAEMENHLKSQ